MKKFKDIASVNDFLCAKFSNKTPSIRVVGKFEESAKFIAELHEYRFNITFYREAAQCMLDAGVYNYTYGIILHIENYINKREFTKEFDASSGTKCVQDMFDFIEKNGM